MAKRRPRKVRWPQEVGEWESWAGSGGGQGSGQENRIGLGRPAALCFSQGLGGRIGEVQATVFGDSVAGYGKAFLITPLVVTKSLG